MFHLWLSTKMLISTTRLESSTSCLPSEMIPDRYRAMMLLRVCFRCSSHISRTLSCASAWMVSRMRVSSSWKWLMV